MGYVERRGTATGTALRGLLGQIRTPVKHEKRLPVKCNMCSKTRHMAMQFPKNALFNNLHGNVEGRVGLELDTWCARIMTRHNLVPEMNMLEAEAAAVLYAHWAHTPLSLGGGEGGVLGGTAVSESLPVPVLLGTDISELDQVLWSNHGFHRYQESDSHNDTNAKEAT